MTRLRLTPAAARATLVAVGVLALLAVVALASRGGLGDSRGGEGGGPPNSLLDYGFTLFMIVYLLSIPVTIWAYLIQQREARAGGGQGPKGRGLLANLFALIGLVAIAALIVAGRRGHGNQPKLKLTPGLTQNGKQKQKNGAEPHQPQFEWPVLAAVVLLGGAGAAYVVLRRGKGELRPVRTLRAELATALDDAIDDVRAERDPRRAVIKAYARMEQILAAHGWPRDPAEAPYEYLARALEAVAASGASVERLTALYERARFSRHEIDSEMRADAIEALTAVRDELREAAAA